MYFIRANITRRVNKALKFDELKLVLTLSSSSFPLNSIDYCLNSSQIQLSEIDEVIFLADRLVVLTNKPTKVRKIININLPRPRSFEMLRSKEAYDYKREAMELLHEEAMKSFTSKDDVANEFMKAYSNN